MLICPRSGLMVSLTYSETFHDFPPSISTKLDWRTFTTWSQPTSLTNPTFLSATLLPHFPFENAKLSTIHLLLLKLYPLKITYKTSDLSSNIFPVSYSVFHSSVPAYGSCLIIAIGRSSFSGCYIICFIRSWVSIQSVFFLSHTL